MSFPRYPKYKPTGVEWLGEVPAHWKIEKLKYLCDIQTGSRDTEHAVGDGPYAFFVRSQTIERIDNFAFDGEAVLTAGDGAGVGKVFHHYTGPFDFHQRVYMLNHFREVTGRYVFHYLRENFYKVALEGAAKSTVDSLRRPMLTDFSVAVPPPAELAAITAFCDRESTKLDALIAEQERLIELLKEKRQAVISHAVTKGLNPKVRMKNSGVEWLGKIPAHWTTMQSRRMFKVRSEPAREDDRQLTASQKHGVIFQSDFVEAEGRRVVEVLMWRESLIHVEPDDFIISMRSFQGGIEWCGLRGSTSYHYVILTPIKHVYPRYFAHLFKSITYIQALRTTTDLIRDGQELRYSNFVQVDLPVVPLDEQVAIAAFLDQETKKIDALVVETERSVALLRERRTALITAAVTGQIDVRSTSIEAVA